MTDSRLGHLTVAQLEAAEDYLGVTLDNVESASRLRLTVLAAWATKLRQDPTVTLASMAQLTLTEVQALAEKDMPTLGEV